MNERNGEHYSNKGGHRERSSFHRDVQELQRYLQRAFTYNPRPEFAMPVEQAHIIRRTMFRDPRDGRR